MTVACHIIVIIKLNNKGIFLSSLLACMNSNQSPVSDSVQQSAKISSTNVHVPTPKYFMPVFLTVIISTLIYIGFQLVADLSHVPALSLYSVILHYLLL